MIDAAISLRACAAPTSTTPSVDDTQHAAYSLDTIATRFLITELFSVTPAT